MVRVLSTFLVMQFLWGGAISFQVRRKVASGYPLSASSLCASSLLYEEHEKLLVKRGEFEAQLMERAPCQPLEATVVKGSGGGGGFGGGSGGGSKKSQLKTQGKAYAKVLQAEGVVRINNVLDAKLADSLRSQVYELRAEAEALVESGALPSLARFADVLLTKNRRDMTLPLSTTESPWTLEAMDQILSTSPIGATMQAVLGPKAILREWSCLMSDPGSQRQVVHPDTPWQEEPVLFTCFIALQDVQLDMGPTTWIPKTHTEAMHAQFQDEQVGSAEEAEQSPKDQLLATQPFVLGTLKKGDCAIFDSRLLHCGGANRSTAELSRALLYCSFQNHKVTQVGNPGSIRKDLIGQWTLDDLQKELQKLGKGKASLFDG